MPRSALEREKFGVFAQVYLCPIAESDTVDTVHGSRDVSEARPRDGRGLHLWFSPPLEPFAFSSSGGCTFCGTDYDDSARVRVSKR